MEASAGQAQWSASVELGMLNLGTPLEMGRDPMARINIFLSLASFLTPQP